MRQLALMLALAGSAWALEVPPPPTGPINDYAGALDSAARDRLDAEVRSWTAGSTRRLAVAIFPSLGGEALEDFSIRVAERWKLGGKKESNGVLLLVFLAEHKLRIEVGYGLEGQLTDARSADIIRQEIAPFLRRGDVAGGVRAGLAAIDTACGGPDHAAPIVPQPVVQQPVVQQPEAEPIISHTEPYVKPPETSFLADNWVLLLILGVLGAIGYFVYRRVMGSLGPLQLTRTPDPDDMMSTGAPPPSTDLFSSSSSSSTPDPPASSSPPDDWKSGGGGSFGGGGASGDW